MPVNYSAPWEAFRSGFDAYGQVIDDQRQRALVEAEAERWKEQQAIAQRQAQINEAIEKRRAEDEAAMTAWHQGYIKRVNDKLTMIDDPAEYPKAYEDAFRESMADMPPQMAWKFSQTQGAEDLRRDLADIAATTRTYGYETRAKTEAMKTFSKEDIEAARREGAAKALADKLAFESQEKEKDRQSREAIATQHDAAIREAAAARTSGKMDQATHDMFVTELNSIANDLTLKPEDKLAKFNDIRARYGVKVPGPVVPTGTNAPAAGPGFWQRLEQGIFRKTPAATNAPVPVPTAPQVPPLAPIGTNTHWIWKDGKLTRVQ